MIASLFDTYSQASSSKMIAGLFDAYSVLEIGTYKPSSVAASAADVVRGKIQTLHCGKPWFGLFVFRYIDLPYEISNSYEGLTTIYK